MDTWRTDAERWLASEQEGQEDVAEAAFAQTFQALPRIEPSADFADRVVAAVWHAHGRRQRRRRWAQRIAALLVIAVGLAIGYTAIDYVDGSMATAGTAIASRVVLRLMVVASAGAWWWSLLARIGEGMNTALGTAQNMAALLALELIGMLALWTLRRLLQGEQDADSGEARR